MQYGLLDVDNVNVLRDMENMCIMIRCSRDIVCDQRNTRPTYFSND